MALAWAEVSVALATMLLLTIFWLLEDTINFLELPDICIKELFNPLPMYHTRKKEITNANAESIKEESLSF
jgi:hypothetical protein